MNNPGVWKTWQGRIVDGKFPLRQWLGGSEHSAVFLTERAGQASAKFAIKLIAADGAGADRQLSLWRGTAQLSHPHLMRIYEMGRCRIDETQLLYVVMEFAEEDLSQILPQRPLSPAEVTDLLPPLLDALAYLHGKGFVHGRIKPSNVLATGDQLKLSSDQIAPSTESSSERRRRDVYDAPETAAGIVTPAGDVWSVGVTLVAALTQNVSFAERSHSDPDLPNTISEPFRGIARDCLHLDPSRRCTTSQIQARLRPAARSVPVARSRPASPSPVSQSRSALKRGPIVAGLLIIAVIVALVIFFSRGKSGTASITPAAEQAAPQAAPESTSQTAPTPPSQSVSNRPVQGSPQAVPSNNGNVVRQVIPEVSRSSLNTIRGTIKISARVEVDSSGRVTSAKLKSAGPSRYFAALALKAAQGWQFSPTQMNGQPATGVWLIQFRLRRSGIQASAEPVNR